MTDPAAIASALALDPATFTAGDEWSRCRDGRLTEAAVLDAYAKVTGLPVADETDLQAAAPLPGVPLDYLQEYLCCPLADDGRTVDLVVAAPYRLARIAWQWRTLRDRDCRFVLARRGAVERLVRRLYEAHAEAATGAEEQQLRDLAREAPIVRLVDDMFARAIEMGASDIHVEPGETDLQVRFRVDGMLQTVLTPPRATYPALASRIKLLGGLNIAERRLPQDGRTDVRIGQATVDVRVSTIPGLHGESLVLRLLRQDAAQFSLDTIGLGADLETRVRTLLGLPHGLLLVVGPTGSGKTTTLYCALNVLNAEARKIITIEDPVEYRVPGVTQMQVHPAIGLTFANGLRHIVRQDPDVILVGEIRDRETADIAVNAALTGHLVLSTLHTNDAAGALSRLVDMGVEDFLLASALTGVLGQRLVRRRCADCAGTGCRACHGTGYRGRTGIFELLEMTDDLRAGLHDNADSARLRALARAHGMRSLEEHGRELVDSGITDAAELARVCQLES